MCFFVVLVSPGRHLLLPSLGLPPGGAGKSRAEERIGFVQVSLIEDTLIGCPFNDFMDTKRRSPRLVLVVVKLLTNN